MGGSFSVHPNSVNDPRVWFLLPILLSSFLAQSVAAGDDAQRILDQLESRLTNEPANPRLLAARGIALGHLGRDGEGLQSLEKALTISPKFLPALEGAAEISYRGQSESRGVFDSRPGVGAEQCGGARHDRGHGL